jgi:hypothetical protein
MGQAKARKQRFYAAHPLCCFCGGVTPAITQDHWPPRSFFIGRIWPDEHVFPACDKCNRASRIHEMLFAMICRIRFNAAQVGLPEEQASAEWCKIADGVARVLPEVYRSMLMPVTDKRRRMRELGIAPQPGQTSRDVPLMSIAHPEFYEAAKTVARKLFSGLYYFRTGRILTTKGGIMFFWRTNSHSLDEFFDDPDVRPMFTMFPAVRRGGNTLVDQFSYAYSVADVEPPSALFGLVFNHAVAMVGVVLGDASHFPALLAHHDMAASMLRPYDWS